MSTRLENTQSCKQRCNADVLCFGGQEGENHEYLHLLLIEDKLPLHTLRSVQDLYIRCFTHPVWPEWAPLTNLTRLALHFGAYHPCSVVPGFVEWLRDLRDVELTATYGALVAEGGMDKLASLMIDLPNLERLLVEIPPVDADRGKGLDRNELKNLEKACREVLRTVQVKIKHRILYFTINGVYQQDSINVADQEALITRLVFGFESVKGS